MEIKKNTNIMIWGLAGFAVVSILGTLLHFAYDFFGGNLAAVFSGVNESTWEHMKLLFYPMAFVTIAESFFLRTEYKSFFCIKLSGIALGLILIPVIFYTLNGAFGKTPDFINIGIFFVAAAAAYVFETLKFINGQGSGKYELSSLIMICLIAAMFVIFTFTPPEIPLFQDPINGSFGV